MKRAVLLACVLAFVVASVALAMPGGSGATPAGGSSDKFTAADADKDGYLSPKEFAAAFPGLKPEAFALIDRDKDGRVSAEEWNGFARGHGSTGHGSSGHGSSAHGSPGSDSGAAALPVVPAPPQQGAGK
ncbi:MAG: hypothetical protein DELT_00156 [Desulfovibrio sp.]